MQQDWGRNEAKQRGDDEDKAAHYLFICKHSPQLPRNDYMEILILKQSARGRKGELFLSFYFTLLFSMVSICTQPSWVRVLGHLCIAVGESVLATHGVSRLAFWSRSGRRCKDPWGCRWTGSPWMRPRQITWWSRQPEGQRALWRVRIEFSPRQILSNATYF